MTVTVTHPGARLLGSALDSLADVVAGDWATAARQCAPRLHDPVACARALDVAAGRAGVVRSVRQRYRYRVHHRILVVDEHPVLLSAALDLYMKVLMGQWDALEKVVLPSSKPKSSWHAYELLAIRIRHQSDHTWSRRPDGSKSLALAPPTARLAHDVLAQLDGSVSEDQYEVPAGRAAVRVG